MKKQYVIVMLAIGCLSLFNVHADIKIKNETELFNRIDGRDSSNKEWEIKTQQFLETKDYAFVLGGHITRGYNDNVETKDNWDLNAKVEARVIEDLAVVGFLKREVDKNANDLVTWDLEVFGKYFFIHSSQNKFFTEIGLKLTKKSFESGESENYSKLKIKFEIEKEITDKVFFKAVNDNFIGLNANEDWEMALEPSLNFKLSKNNTLRFGYFHKYKKDNNPLVNNNNYGFILGLILKH
ncbi:MAG: hypothetical protein ACJAT2_002222 [Bacteriovoracaceae bacterium]|jgi:hypothetical protein